MHRRLLHGALARRDVRVAVCVLLIGGSYYGAARLGMSLSVSRGVITPVWAPSGIALASLLILGVRYWPPVAAAAFLANATSGATVAVATGIAVGNTAAVVVAALLVQRIGFTAALDRIRSVLALVAGALVGSAISATNGVTVLTVAHDSPDTFASAWLLWWFADAMGILVVAPVILVAYDASRRQRPPPRRLLEGALLLVAILAVSAIVFLAGAWRYPWLIFPFLLWAAIRFRQRGAATSAFLVGALGTWGAVEGTVPLGGATATERVQLAQASFAVVIVSLLVVGATLSEREAGRQALASTASRLGEAQALAHIGSWEWDIGRDIVVWSEELYHVFGLDQDRPERLTYATYLGLVHPDDRQLADEGVRRALEDGRPYSLEHRIVRPDGDERIVASRGRVVFDGRKPVTMMGTGQDVTEARQVERLREDILSAVSHELRTPLTSVLGFALTLEKHRATLTSETIDDTVAALAQAARRLDRLLVDLLDVERLRRGLVTLRREPVEAAELVERVVAECALDDREVAVDCEPVVAEVDRAKLERIVENLVVNAHKHTPVEGSIAVRLAPEGRNLLLVVEDEGPGIPDEFKEVVFETFNRGPNILATTPGAGIDLSLVARFAAVHGGRCWVEDRPGGGASFRVLLPDCVSETARPAEAR